jgi:hypothetical protein
MADQTRLEYVVEQLEGGHMSTADAARLVRSMKFPAKPGKTPYQVITADATEDPEPPEKDSFFAVSHAYTMGRITRAQYEALAQAASKGGARNVSTDIGGLSS